MRQKIRFGLLLMILFFIPCMAMAMGGKCGKELKWDLDNGVLTIYGKGEMKNYSKSDQPWRISLVKEIVIKEGLTTIGSNAFAGAKILSVTIPEGVTEIGENSFKGCSKLITVTLPYGVKRIDKEAFAKCSSLSKINIPSTVEVIGENSFEKCTVLTSLSLPAQIKTVGAGAFSGCVSLTEIGMLPEFINRNNAARFGLSYSVVDAYRKKKNTKSVESDSKTPANPGVNKDLASGKVPEKGNRIGKNIPAYGTADIDESIPVRQTNAVNTFAIIFANEHYNTLANVPFALNDGKSVQTYFHNTLGIPMENINFYPDATLGNMRQALSYIKEVDEVYNGDISLIVYYAGHGAPDESTSEAFLVPTDAYKVNKDVCLPMTEFYETLGSLQAKSVKVFLDACFSGAVRTGDMIAENRGISIKPKNTIVKGNVAVVSATTDDQTAWQYAGTGHGLFTYFLLKKLQESKGEASMGDIVDYLQEKVPQKSIVENRRVQTPTASSSADVENKWRSWQLK